MQLNKQVLIDIMANDEKETNVVENESPAQLQKVSDKVPVAKREVIEVNKDTINAINCC